MIESNLSPFQQRVQPWLMACFGPMIAADVIERNHRFLEEALELVQACGCDRSEAHQLVDYVYDRPVGEKGQEVGGVMVTLAALCLAQGMDMHACGEIELARVWTKVEQIRAKQAAKPKHSPLPEHKPPVADGLVAMARETMRGLSDPATLHLNLLMGFPARLSKRQLAHLIGGDALALLDANGLLDDELKVGT